MEICTTFHYSVLCDMNPYVYQLYSYIHIYLKTIRASDAISLFSVVYELSLLYY